MFFFGVLLLLPFSLFGIEYTEINNRCQINIQHLQNGFSYTVNFFEKKRANTGTFIVTTNVNHATVSFTNYMNNKTNEFFIITEALITPTDWVEIGFTEVILAPEIQLKPFLQNNTLTNLNYIYVDPKNLEILTANASKLKKTNNLQSVLVTFEEKSQKNTKILYHFDKTGNAVKTEIFLKKSNKPNYTLKKTS